MCQCQICLVLLELFFISWHGGSWKNYRSSWIWSKCACQYPFETAQKCWLWKECFILEKGSTVSDYNSQIYFWEETVVRVQMPSSSGNFQSWTTAENCSSCHKCQICSISFAVLGLKECSLLPQISRYYQRLILMGLSSRVFLIWDWVPGRSMLLSAMCCIDPP